MAAVYECVEDEGIGKSIGPDISNLLSEQEEVISLPLRKEESHRFSKEAVPVSILQDMPVSTSNQIWLVAITFSIAATETIVAGMEWLLKGAITYDYLLTGFVASLMVASSVSALLLRFTGQLDMERQQRQHLTKRLAKSEEQARQVAMASRFALWDYDLIENTVSLSEGWTQLLGGRLEKFEHATHDASTYVPEEVVAQVKEAIIVAVKEQGSSYCLIIHRVCKLDGQFAWIQSEGRVVERDTDGRALRLMGTSQDITERKKAEDEMRVAATTFETAEGIIVTDRDGTILRVNEAFTKITGYSAEEMSGQNPRILKSDKHSGDFYREMLDAINLNGRWQGEVWNRRKNGDVYPEWLKIAAVKDMQGQVTHYVGSFTDISGQKQTEASIYQLAFYDQLTSLPNRRLLLDRLFDVQARSERNKQFGAVMFLDLDNFKTINDTMGHSSGDQLLTEVAKRIHATIRNADMVSRFGGDEFIVLLEGLGIFRELAAEQVGIVGDKLLVALRKPYELNGIEVTCSVSIGAKLFHGRKEGWDDLLKHSDVAMYEAKKAGRNTLCFFDLDMQIAIEERVQLEADLRGALKRNEFKLYFQKRVDQQGHTKGAEVLLRWMRKMHHEVPPAEFISLAEETGLIVSIGQWVFEKACEQLKEWEGREETKHLMLSVNISPKEFKDKSFIEQIGNVLRQTGANPNLLELEITESMLLEEVEDCIDKIRALKKMGMSVALDDFGTGYSSLSYLKQFPLDMLKIDQSFVRDLGRDENDEVIVQTIIQMGQNLGMDVIAEGVELPLQRVILEHMGCYNYQGYLFGRPEPIEIFGMSLGEK